MKVFTSSQIKAWDAYTIAHEPVSSLNLMERAAQACTQWIKTSYPLIGKVFYIFAGKGNNGGDGLAIARLLLEQHIPVLVYILEFGSKGTDDFQANLERLHALTSDIHFIQSEATFPPLPDNAVLIDALLGSGLNRPLEGLTANLVRFMNKSKRPTIAIDLPSGMRADEHSAGDPTIEAVHTLALGSYKLGLLLAENAPCFGEVHLLPIGLSPDYEADTYSPYQLSDLALAQRWYKPRNAFAHKGTFGHALLAAGGNGKMGACILASKACLRSGVGLLTALVPAASVDIIQICVPEAMALTDIKELSAYKSLGVGPGLGTTKEALDKLSHLLSIAPFPIVIDADALNLLSQNPALWERVPPYSILTPHPKEFERLFGPSANDYAQLAKALEQAAERRCHIVLKGHRTFIASPDGSGYFNTTGNAGMATGGSGDVLTGILTGLLAQGYPPQHAAILGVYLHGLAGDCALDGQSMESLLSSDIAEGLGAAFGVLARG
jgi:ADP-dependent NAD(P)H-hydrate dehydratase / NAD(P)H-hydrate epimerase